MAAPSAHLLAVVARLVRVDVLVLVGAGPLGRGVLHARLVLALGHPLPRHRTGPCRTVVLLPPPGVIST